VVVVAEDKLKSKNELRFGFLGMRAIKTVLAVFICFILAYFRRESPVYSTIAAVISMKTNHLGGIVEGKNRMKGTIIGGVFGLICVVLLEFFRLDNQGLLAYLIFSLFLIPIIYSNLKIQSQESVSLSCIVFLVIVATDTHVPAYTRVLNRTLETFIGVIVSIFINRYL